MTTQIVLLSGKQGSGKTTTAGNLKAFWQSMGIPVINYKFAQPLYDMHNVLYLVAKDYGIEPPPGGMDKSLLQVLGTEWGRNTRGEGIWIRCAQRKIEKMTSDMNAAGQFNIVIIDDVRFRNELLDMGDALKIRIECDREVRKQRCSCWRDNEAHQSEVDLDAHLDKFDLIVDSGANSSEHIKAKIADFCMPKFPPPFTDVDRTTVEAGSVKINAPHIVKPQCQ